MILGFTGHQNIPNSHLEYFENSLKKCLDDIPGRLVGICSLAAGSDQMFAEDVLAKNGELRVIIPCDEYESTFNTADLAKYKTLLSQASEVIVLDFPHPSEKAYMEAGTKVVDACETLISFWDGKNSRGLGGTADIVKYAASRGKRVENIWPEGLER